MATEVQYDFNPQDWSTFDTSLVLDAGYAMWFYNNDEYGVDMRFHVIGDGNTTVANLDRFLPQSASGASILTINSDAYAGVMFGTINKVSDSVLRATLPWGCMPKQDATTLSLTTQSNIRVIGFNQAVFSLSSSDTIDNVVSEQNTVIFALKNTDGYTALASNVTYTFRTDYTITASLT